MARPKGTEVTFSNQEVKDLLAPLREQAYDAESFSHLVPDWLDNCLRGASGQMQGTSRPSTYRVFSNLATLSTISSTTVGGRLNKKRRALEGKDYSYSYINQWVKCLRCASQAIKHHAPAEGLEYLRDSDDNVRPVVTYTPEQKEHIRYLAVAGKLDELSAYVKEITNV